MDHFQTVEQMSCGNMSYLPNCGIYNHGTPYADNKVSSIKPALSFPVDDPAGHGGRRGVAIPLLG